MSRNASVVLAGPLSVEKVRSLSTDPEARPRREVVRDAHAKMAELQKDLDDTLTCIAEGDVDILEELF